MWSNRGATNALIENSSTRIWSTKTRKNVELLFIY